MLPTNGNRWLPAGVESGSPNAGGDEQFGERFEVWAVDDAAEGLADGCGAAAL